MSGVPHIRKDITGKVFGRLTATGRDELTRKWECLCSCGGKALVKRSNLLEGKQRSCGCLYRETRGAQSRTHGMSSTPEYKTWKNMKYRCYNQRSKDYRLYGAKGIVVCDRWLASFENFFADIGPRPAGMTIDRFQNKEGNYEPGNCRWASPVQQANNTSRNISVTIGDRTMNFSQWCREFGIDNSFAHARMQVCGWSPEKALTMPKRGSA
jgi:hypothetical protein